MIHNETSPLKELVERNDFGAPHVSPVKFKGAEFRDIDSVFSLELLKRTDH